MKILLTFPLAFIFIVLLDLTASAQLRTPRTLTSTFYFINSHHTDNLIRRWSLPGLKGDKQATVYRPAAPILSLPVNTTSLQGNSYWMGSVTTQSYHQGKIGRFYCWDIQGNLRGSYLFLDIAGRNKRGLKLVFPRHRSVF
ncbi:MAG: hypothetical protein C0490_13420 [Marivirga sp.]|nr:hypothetical protein [Marivirga sp.]